jgi:hypothetical protein
MILKSVRLFFTASTQMQLGFIIIGQDVLGASRFNSSFSMNRCNLL